MVTPLQTPDFKGYIFRNVRRIIRSVLQSHLAGGEKASENTPHGNGQNSFTEQRRQKFI
jgi:hypothetical protein